MSRPTTPSTTNDRGIRRALLGAARLASSFLRAPIATMAECSSLGYALSARRFASSTNATGKAEPTTADTSDTADEPSNPLELYFRSNRTGPGIWKWSHYFEAYHRHLGRFIGQAPRVLEIGVYSGGSLRMWQEYFGPGTHLIGVDIEPDCRCYARNGVEIVIGDQGDRDFWRRFRAEHGAVDIVIDDGGHTPEQQRATLEELLPHVNNGGVYICEDIHGASNRFAAYVATLTAEMSGFQAADHEGLHSRASGFQSLIRSIHCYPYLVALERTTCPRHLLEAPRMGSEWQPFYDADREPPAQ